MPDKSTNTTPRPSASNGRGTLGSTPLAASLEPTSSPDTRPTSAVGQPAPRWPTEPEKNAHEKLDLDGGFLPEPPWAPSPWLA